MKKLYKKNWNSLKKRAYLGIKQNSYDYKQSIRDGTLIVANGLRSPKFRISKELSSLLHKTRTIKTVLCRKPS